jgi:hypothetical protein
MLKEVLDILSYDFTDRFKKYIESENIKSLFLYRIENFTDLIIEVLPPLDALKILASGKTSENVIFEGVLMYCITQLNAQGKIPESYIDNIIHFAGSFFNAQKLIPIIQIDDEDIYYSSIKKSMVWNK